MIRPACEPPRAHRGWSHPVDAAEKRTVRNSAPLVRDALSLGLPRQLWSVRHTWSITVTTAHLSHRPVIPGGWTTTPYPMVPWRPLRGHRRIRAPD
jgi:hypothetical protein